MVTTYVMNTYWGGGGGVTALISISTRWGRVTSFVPRLYYAPGKSPRYPLDKRKSGPPSPAGGCGEMRLLVPVGNATRIPTFQPIFSLYLSAAVNR
jgi:hypothetical protein